MKKLLLSTVALMGLTVAAGAADLPRRTVAPVAPIVAVPLFTWTGFYVGVNAGYHFGGSSDYDRVGSFNFTGPQLANNVPLGFSNDREGFIGGAQAGFNFQFGMFVAGIEADIQFADIGSRTDVFLNPGGTFFPSTSFAENEIEYLGTVRGRLGVAFDRALFYVTGGLAYGDVNNSVSVTFDRSSVGLGPRTFLGSNGSTEVGYTLGGGVEYAFTNNLTLKAEYLYYDLGSTTVLATNPFTDATLSYRAENDGHIARVGINYKF